MDARPDQEEMEEAINNFLLQLEKQEKKSFTDLAIILSQLPKPTILHELVRFVRISDSPAWVLAESVDYRGVLVGL